MTHPITELTVIFPVYNEKATILDLLQRVPTVDMGRLDKDIIVVDNASTDATTNLLENARNFWSLNNLSMWAKEALSVLD